MDEEEKKEEDGEDDGGENLLPQSNHGSTVKTEIKIVPFGFLIVPHLKSPILGGKFGLFGPHF